MSKHGIFIHEEGTALSAPITSGCSIQVVIGTAPVNMATDPAAVVNKPILANSAQEAMAALGYSTDFAAYTLCQTMYATANIYQVAPVVYINVLDPKKHKKALTETTYQVNQMQAVVNKPGVLLDGLTVKGGTGSSTLTKGTDYTAEFDSATGYLIITLLENGAGKSETSLKVSGNVLDPSMVTKTEIIGAYDPSTGAETGAQLIRRIYPSLGVVPGLILAPGWSQIPEVGVALAAKAANINGVFKAMALLDLDTTKATKYTDCKKVKEDSGYTSAHCMVLWPYDKVGELILAKSAVVAAMMAYQDTENDDVPNLSPSNKLLGVTGQCLADGTEVCVDQDQASTINTYGVVTATNVNGWRCWGNYTGAFPGSNDAKDIWIPVRRMFDWQGNTFILTYFDKVDDPMNQAKPSRAMIRFTLSGIRPNAVEIPEGTRVTNGEVYFQTESHVEIPAGGTSVDVAAECMTSGIAGNNLEAGEINVLVDPVPYVAKVANTEPTTGGADIEDDDTLKDRIYIAPSKYSVAGPEESYRYWVKTYNSNISDVLIYSDDPVDVVIEFIMNDGELPSESMLLGVQKFLSDEQIRPLTDRVTVKAPETVEYKVNVKYFVNQSDLKKVDTIKAAVNAAVDDYIKWQRSKIGRDINPSQLIQQMVSAGAKRVEVSLPVFQVIGKANVAKLSSKTVTYGGLEDD